MDELFGQVLAKAAQELDEIRATITDLELTVAEPPTFNKAVYGDWLMSISKSTPLGLGTTGSGISESPQEKRTKVHTTRRYLLKYFCIIFKADFNRILQPKSH